MAELGLTGLVVVALAMLCGGAVKGMVGIGLPIVSISIMSSFLGAPTTALALLIMPIMVTNLWQLARAGHARSSLKRFWPILLALPVGIWWSAGLVVRVSPEMLFGLLGAVVLGFCATAYLAPNLRVAAPAETWAGAVAGLAGGLIGGVSTVYGPPITLYLVALRLPKEVFIGATGLIWFCAALPLTAAYVYHGVLTAELAAWSALACIPAIGGQFLGQRVRDRIDQEGFRKLLLLALLLLGLNLIRRALL